MFTYREMRHDDIWDVGIAMRLTDAIYTSKLTHTSTFGALAISVKKSDTVHTVIDEREQPIALVGFSDKGEYVQAWAVSTSYTDGKPVEVLTAGESVLSPIKKPIAVVINKEDKRVVKLATSLGFKAERDVENYMDSGITHTVYWRLPSIQ